MSGGFDRLRRAAAFVARHYLVIMAPLSAALSALNYNGKAMHPMLAYYRDYEHIILAGFDPSVARMGVPTFPMWGYGWLLIVTENKVALIVIQNALALFSYWFFFTSADKHALFDRRVLVWTKVLLVLALPLYGFHSILWPYSVGFSLLLVSFTLLTVAMKAEGAPDWPRLVGSGLVFGLMLNFRSDYCMLPVPILGALILVSRTRRLTAARGLVWAASLYVMLLPWGFYAKQVSGRFALTSSNGGMAIYCGLGNLPNNVWGITVSDEDPSAHAFVRRTLGPDVDTLSAQADPVLKAEALRLVLAHKGEYAKRLAYVTFRVLTGGVYPPEFFVDESCVAACGQGFVHALDAAGGGAGISSVLAGIPVALAHPEEAHIPRIRMLGAALTAAGYAYGVVTLLASFLVAPLTLLAGWRRRDALPVLCVVVIFFQAMINILIAHAPPLSTNAYFMDLLNLAFAMTLLADRRRAASAEPITDRAPT
jgi:hypothetical protein